MAKENDAMSIKYYASEFIIDQPDQAGRTPLWSASKGESRFCIYKGGCLDDIVPLLIKAGADVNQSNK